MGRRRTTSPTRRPDVCPQGWLPPPPRVHAAAFGCGSEPEADAEVDVMEQDLSLQDIVGT